MTAFDFVAFCSLVVCTVILCAVFVLDRWRRKAWSAEQGEKAGPCSLLPAFSPAPWTAMDMQSWKAVLASEVGKRFIARARAVHFALLNEASKDHFHAAQNVHAARGWGEALQWLQSLSCSCDAQQEKPDSGAPGEAPAAERELEAIQERMSPR